MRTDNHTPEQFKRKAILAVLAIIAFIISYLVLFLIASFICFQVFSAAYTLVINQFSIMTLILGVGMVIGSSVLLIYLFKFVFQVQKNDLNHLVEIYAKDQKQLFQLIHEIADKAGSSYPKRVFLTSDVNALVFYNSSFWSMFLPIRKNLIIGMGLLNSLDVEEFKAVLAHEFGHFSQDSMKIGSYAFNMNKIIHNLLYENASFDEVLNNISRSSWVFYIFIWIALRIMWLFRWILQQVYSLVHLSYMGLSREMEFHADEIAAKTVGAKPLQDALLRLDLAAQSFISVTQYYERYSQLGIRSKNIFPKQTLVMNQMAQQLKIPMEGTLPNVQRSHLALFNHSKIDIENKYASHPETIERLERLDQFQEYLSHPNLQAASSLINNKEALQEKLTKILFQNLPQTKKQNLESFEGFKKKYLKQIKDMKLPEIYNEYYDQHSPDGVQLSTNLQGEQPILTREQLFAPSKIKQLQEHIILENDIGYLKLVENGQIPVDTFQYNHKKYTKRNLKSLIKALETDLKNLKHAIAQNDQDIYNFYQYKFVQAKDKNKLLTLNEMYADLMDSQKRFDNSLKFIQSAQEELSFIEEVLPFESIKEKLSTFNIKEQELKERIQNLMNNKMLQSYFSEHLNFIFDQFLNTEMKYFESEQYQPEAIYLLQQCMDGYLEMQSTLIFAYKKRLLEFQIQ